MKKEYKISLNDLWWIPAVVPLLFIVISFLMEGWYWGLMDDLKQIYRQGSIIEHFVSLINGFVGLGRFYPVTCLHWALFYKIFANCPTGFYLLRWIEIVTALGLWGLFIIEVTGKKWSAGLFIAIVLGFYKFYDGFFYLSICEPLGILFAAPATLFFFRAISPVLDEDRKINWKMAGISLFFLLLSIGSKETFFIVAAAFGLAAFLFSFKDKNTKPLFIVASGFLFLAASYVLFIKLFIMRSYSADYVMTNMGKLVDNMLVWLGQDFPWHVPWVLISVLLLIFAGKPSIRKVSYRFALVLSVLLYSGYIVVLLPWSTGGHYSFPLGIFFALIVTIIIIDRLEVVNRVIWSAVFLAILCFNIFVSSSALQSHHSYQLDSKNLATWIAQDAIFEHDVTDGGALVRINAMEPGDTIPMMVQRLYGKEYNSFVFTSNVRQILDDPNTKYYLWGTSWGDQDLRRLGPLWTPVFISDNWIMFRRMY